jgi:hypothetical protein
MGLFGFKKKEEIKELKERIDNLEKELLEQKKKEEELSEEINKVVLEKEEEIKHLKSHYNVKQVQKIVESFDALNLEYNSLKNEMIKLQKENSLLREENTRLSEEKNQLENKVSELEELKTKLLEELAKKEVYKQEDKFEKRYRVTIKDLYAPRKYDEFKKICETLSIVYVDDLENFDFDKLGEQGLSKTKINNAKKEYINFKNELYTPEIREYIEKGHRVSKIFFRYRTLVKHLEEKGIIYMKDLREYNLDELMDKDKFTSEKIEKFKKIIKEYEDLRGIFS